jgi:hypothetical protein
MGGAPICTGSYQAGGKAQMITFRVPQVEVVIQSKDQTKWTWSIEEMDSAQRFNSVESAMEDAKKILNRNRPALLNAPLRIKWHVQ